MTVDSQQVHSENIIPRRMTTISSPSRDANHFQFRIRRTTRGNGGEGLAEVLLMNPSTPGRKRESITGNDC